MQMSRRRGGVGVLPVVHGLLEQGKGGIRWKSENNEERSGS